MDQVEEEIIYKLKTYYYNSLIDVEYEFHYVELFSS